MARCFAKTNFQLASLEMTLQQQAELMHSGGQLLHQLAAEMEVQKDSWPNAQLPSW